MRDAHGARALCARVRRHPEELALQRHVHGANQVGQEHESALEDADEERTSTGVVLGDLPAELGNPLNQTVEYTILRAPDGKPVFVDGEPVVTFGPRDHLSKEEWAKWKKRGDDWAERKEDWGHLQRLRFGVDHIEGYRFDSVEDIPAAWLPDA